MSQSGIDRLEMLHKLNEDPSWLNKDLYRLLYKPALYCSAWRALLHNQGSTCAKSGSPSAEQSLSRIIGENIEQLRQGRFRFGNLTPVRASLGNEQRQTTGPFIRPDRLVEEAVRMILEAIFDSRLRSYFLDCSYGLRRERGSQTALREIRKWQGLNWLVAGDIADCCNRIPHGRLVELVARKISDTRFLDLLRNALKSGCLSKVKSRHQHSGLPQLGPLAPVLANLYLHELDRYIVERTTADRHITGFRYLRCFDQWIIGVWGPKRLACQISDEMTSFLGSAFAPWSHTGSTTVRHAKSEQTPFLGALICSEDLGNKTSRSNRWSNRKVLFEHSVRIRIDAPIDKIVKQLNAQGFCDAGGRPTHQTQWIPRRLDEIVTRSNVVLRDCRTYFGFADNFGKLRRVEYIVQYSCAKTITAKMRLQSVKKTFSRYGKALRVPVVCHDRFVQLDLISERRRAANRSTARRPALDA